MRSLTLFSKVTALALSLIASTALAAPPPAASFPNETPQTFAPVLTSFDFERRDVMIPMRDGVKLKTVIWIPKGAHRAPILLTRTPYNASDRGASAVSEHLDAVLGETDTAGDLVTQHGYIRVVQDVRGKYGSEGDYQMNRAPAGPQNPTGIDDSTDAYDTIDWLVKNVPETNGKVGILGISYDGFTSVMALFHPHPALKAAMPINPMVDGWMGDDWFHQGAFRTSTLSYIHDQEATRDNSVTWWSDHYDDYDAWMVGSAGDVAHQHGLEQTGFWPKILAHPAYDAFWQDQALDKLLAKQGLTVPTMLVHSLWDQEDIYGAQAIWRAVKPGDTAGNLFMTMGPWFHHQARLDGSAVGAIKAGGDTAAWFRAEVVAPFFDHYLKDDGASVPLPSTVTAFETGANHWEHLSGWPQGCESGCRIEHRPLYLHAGGGLGFDAPAAASPGFDRYVSDPAKPVPYLPRPIHTEGDEGEKTWQTWLVSDQRPAAARTDVLTYTSAPLEQPLKLAGEPIANLVASTTGTDGDFVVKLIDVYPDEVGRDPAMGGYQLMIAVDILRGRYREGFAVAKPITPGKPLTYHVRLPTVNHVFLPGHRLMVQVQSSLFPVYDRNPQTFTPNIFQARPADYKPAEIHVYDAGTLTSTVDLPVVVR